MDWKMNWRKDPPKTGEWIFGFWECMRDCINDSPFAVVRYARRFNESRWEDQSGCEGLKDPDFWMPLPPLPPAGSP